MKCTLAFLTASLLAGLSCAIVNAQDATGGAGSPPVADSQPATGESEPSSSPATPSVETPGAPAEETASDTIKIIELRFMQASEVSRMLTPLFKDAGVTIVLDERTNSLVVRGSESHVSNIEALVEFLDRDSPLTMPAAPPAGGFQPGQGGPSAPAADDPEKRQTRIFQLRHSIASELNSVLQGVFPETLLGGEVRWVQSVSDDRSRTIFVRFNCQDANLKAQVDALVPYLDRSVGSPNESGSDGLIPGENHFEPAPFRLTPTHELERGLQVFALKNANANDAWKLVVRLFGDDRGGFGADSRTNTFVARAFEHDLREIDSIVQHLDQSSAGAEKIDRPATDVDSAGGGAPQPAAPEIADVGVLQERLRALDRDVARLAAESRHSQPGSSSDEPPTEEATAELRTRVAELFETRQAVQRAELAELRARMDRVERQIEVRERVREQIIERRVQELLKSDAALPPPAEDTLFKADASPDAASPAAHRAHLEFDHFEQLQGTWLAIEQGLDGKTIPFKQPITLTFRENQYEFREGGSEPYSSGAFRVAHPDTLAWRATIELTRTWFKHADPDDIRASEPQVERAVFAIEGGRLLRMCSVPGDPTLIPTEFSTTPNDGRQLMVYERISDRPLTTDEHRAIKFDMPQNLDAGK